MGDSMTVALGPWGRGEGGGGGQQGNALGVGNIMGLMGDAMKLRQSQQEWNARQEFGNIAISSPDLDTALQRAQQNPLVAGFAPQLMTELRNQRLLESQVQGQTLTQTQTAREALQQTLLGVTDPDRLAPTLRAAFGKFSPQIQNTVEPYGSSVLESLTGGLPSDPAARQAEFAKRKAAFMIATKLGTPETAFTATGAGVWVPPGVKDVTQPSGAVTPMAYGGLMTPGGAPGVGAPLGPGQTTAQKEYQTARTQDMTKYQASLDNAVSDGTNLMATLQEGRDAMKTAATGGLSSARAGFARLAQGLGASAETVNKIAGGDLAATQEFQKLAPSMAMAQLRQQIPSGSRLNRQEWEAFEGANPNIDMDPHAIDKIFNFWTRIHVRNRIEQQQMGDYLHKGGDISGWPAEWAKRSQSLGLVGPVFRSRDGTEVTPQDIDTLLNRPDQAAAFDKHYGKGAAASFLNLQQ